MNITLLRIVNTLLLLAFLGILVSILLRDVLPTPLQGSETAYEMHEWSGRALIVLALAHLWLNRRWIAAQLKKKPKGR